MDPANQRQAPRARVTWRAVHIQEGRNNLLIKVVDISEGGIGVITQNNYAIGQVLNIGMEIPAPNNLNKKTQHICRTAVVHTVLSNEGYRVGLRFLEINEAHKALIKAWVAKYIAPG